MFPRYIELPKTNSFFLFGPRGTGKSTLLHSHFSSEETLFIDLLDPNEEDILQRNPKELEYRIQALPKIKKRIVIDEVQKVPRILDTIHHLIETQKKQFILTGSSPRKLKRGASNLLAGRAFVQHLFPLTHNELKASFNLADVLSWGTLPKIFHLSSHKDRADFLRAYALTYLKEEIFAEQIIRKLEPFRNFLEISAQCNGQILNYLKISQDIGVDIKTVQSYFTILEDTLIGFFLPSYHRSVRKRQRINPKFYFFDLGVKRTLERMLLEPLQPKTYAYGLAFEHFIVAEIYRLISYQKKDWLMSYLRTKDSAEIDLIIDCPNTPPILIEIKSSDNITERDVSSLQKFAPDFSKSKLYCFSQDPHPKKINKIYCLPWQKGLFELGLA